MSKWNRESRWNSDDDQEDDDDQSDFEQEDYETEDDSDEPMVSCSECGLEILEESLRCPYCGGYQSEQKGWFASQPTWVLVTASLCLLAIVLGIVSQLTSLF